jgi:epoxyqueuosine reductase
MPSLSTQHLTHALKEKARFIGFDSIGITSPFAIPDAPKRLQDWLHKGFAADMDWMHTRAEQRANPAILWPDVNSIIMLGVNYAPDDNPLHALEKLHHAAIATYARRRDYHDVIKGQLKQLAQWFVHTCGAGVKVFVDTAPVMEKALAQAAGLGWQGKHTVLVSRDYGNWLFLGAIYTTAHLTTDVPEIDHCGSCTKCLTICPTHAFAEPYVLDSSRCIAYLTIEHKGSIARDLRPFIGNRIFGCDDCLAVCPWNKFAQEARHARLMLHDHLRELPLKELVTLDDGAFRTLFAGTPIKRTGRERFIRNVLIAIGNTADPIYEAALDALLMDPSPLIRGACIWALSRICPFERFHVFYEQYFALERDFQVLEEWSLALKSYS